MFGWFSAKCPVDDQTKLWIERRMAWLTHEFGWSRILNAPVVLPSHDYFPDAYDGTQEAARDMLQRVCEYMAIEPQRVELEFYSENVPQLESDSGTVGLYETQENRTMIWLEASHLEDPLSVAATLTHELAHVHLLGSGRIAADEEDSEPLTDLLPVFWGLGVIVANSTIRDRSGHVGNWEFWSISRQGYLTAPIFGYALALFAWVREELKPDWVSALRPDVRAPFRKGLAYLVRTGNSTYVRNRELSPEHSEPCPRSLLPRNEHATAEQGHSTEDVAEDLSADTERTSDDCFTVGTLLAQEGDLAGAVVQYSEAIRRSPNDAESYLHRSLAYFQLGKLDKASLDRQEAFRLDPELAAYEFEQRTGDES